MTRLLRFAMLLAVLAVRSGLYAQKDTSLTRAFDGLSAKERSRIAKQEQEGSMKDTDYQAVMTQAEDSFRDQRYDEALLLYIKARELRPYNVYPKVKIQDLQALIARRDAPADPVANVEKEPGAQLVPELGTREASPPDTVLERPVEPEKQPVAPSVIPAASSIPARARKPTEERSASTEQSKPTEGPDAQATRSFAERTTAPAQVPDGLVERVYKEGNAVVRERRVMREGRGTIYRQVSHPYGATVYFKDGIAVTQRIWDAVLTE